MLNIVVARYQENIDWLNKIDSSHNIYLYNKGAPINPCYLTNKNIKIVEISNVGRETDTYFHHIENTNFPDNDGFTIFTQGDPFEHSPQFLEIIKNTKEWKDIQPLSMQWIGSNNIPPQLIIANERQDWINKELIIRRERFSLKTWAPLSFFDQGAWNIGLEYKKIHYLTEGTNIAAHFLNLIEMNEHSAACKEAEIGFFAYGAIFAIKNYRGKEFKEKFAKRIPNIRKIANSNNIFGYMHERLWLHLFGEKFIGFEFIDTQVNI